MDRRAMLSGVGALTAAPMLAQAAWAKPAMMMGPMDTAYMKKTAMLGSLSLLACRRAVGKITTPKLQEFLAFETAEQETIGNILMGMMKPASEASGMVVPPTDAEAMANVGPDGLNTLSMMSSMTGMGFETDFVKAQTDTHQKLLTVQDDYLMTGHNRGALNIAKLAKGMITEHLKLLGDIQMKMA